MSLIDRRYFNIFYTLYTQLYNYILYFLVPIANLFRIWRYGWRKRYFLWIVAESGFASCFSLRRSFWSIGDCIWKTEWNTLRRVKSDTVAQFGCFSILNLNFLEFVVYFNLISKSMVILIQWAFYFIHNGFAVNLTQISISKQIIY